MKNIELIKEIDQKYKGIQTIILQSEYKLALKEINTLYNKSSEINYVKGINLYHENLCFIAYYKFDNHLALTVSQHLISIYEQEQNTDRLNIFYTVLGTILTRLSDFESSKYYLNKALKLNLKESKVSIKNISTTYSSLAYNSIQLKQFNDALEFLNEGLKYYKPKQIPNTKDTRLVYLYAFKIRTLLHINQIEGACDLYKLIFKNNTNLQEREKIYVNEVFLELQVFKRDKTEDNEFLELLHTSLEKAIDISDGQLTIKIYKFLKEYHNQNKNYELAYKYADLVITESHKEDEKQINVLNNKLNIIPINKDSTENYSDFELYKKSDIELASNYQKNFHKTNLKSNYLKVDTYFKSLNPLSGDYIGTFNLCNNDKQYLVVLADVVGNGISSSYISFMLDGIIKSIILNSDSFNLKTIIKDINIILSDSLNNHGYVSLWVGLINLEKNEIESINAGHMPTYIISEKNKISSLTKGCTILGMFKELNSLESEKVPFNKGNSIIAYSNGLTDATDHKGQKYGMKFTQLISDFTENNNKDFISLLKKDFKEHLDKNPIQADTSCLYIEYLKE